MAPFSCQELFSNLEQFTKAEKRSDKNWHTRKPQRLPRLAGILPVLPGALAECCTLKNSCKNKNVFLVCVFIFKSTYHCLKNIICLPDNKGFILRNDSNPLKGVKDCM